MKKLLLVLMILALTTPAALAAPQTIDLETMTMDELQELDLDVHDAIEALTPEPEQQDVIEGGETSRKNPAPINQTVLYDGDRYYNPATTEFTVTKVVRGESANATVKKWNRFNDKPGKDEEYMLIYVKAKAVESDSDEQATIDEYRFAVVSASGVEYNRIFSSGRTPEFTNLYPGAECEGVIVGLIPKADQPLLVYMKDADQPIWFDLNKRKPIVLPDDAVINPLKKGDKGDEVLVMQEMLTEMGYLKVAPDGNYGNKSVEAVKAYQKAMGIEVTGQADEATLRLILTMQMP